MFFQELDPDPTKNPESESEGVNAIMLILMNDFRKKTYNNKHPLRLIYTRKYFSKKIMNALYAVVVNV